MPTWDDRLPFLSSSGRETMLRRYRACQAPIARTLGVSEEQLARAKLLGCGNYGCTFLVEGLPSGRNVIKVTSDNLEAHTIQLLTEWDEKKPEGIVGYHGVWRLGKCSVLPRMRPFVYKRREMYSGWRPQTTWIYYKGPGAPYRPIWVVQREELPDVKGPVRALGVGPKKLQEILYVLQTWARNRARDWGAPGAVGQAMSRISDDEMSERLRPVRGEALMEALDWLMERHIGFYDFTKITNLGWREGTGLVIRDIGFASTEMGSAEDPSVLEGLRGLRGLRPRLWE